MAHSASSYCQGCGSPLKVDSRFCSQCGRKLTLRRQTRLPFKPWMMAPAAALAALLVLLPTGLYVWAGLPSTSNLSTARLPLSTRIYDRTGTVLLAEIHQGSERRHIVSLAQVSPTMRAATIAVEDRTFYQHGALNLLRTGQAGLEDLLHLRFDQGGSTITQQLVKNIYLTEDRSILRKLDEVILAIEVEHQYSKNQILEAYLNRIYYGNQSYGVEAASETYFGKPATQLTLPEASLLAGLPQAPTVLDPYTNMAGAKARQRVVLDAMVRAREINASQAKTAAAQKLALRPATSADDVKAPGFVHWVAAQLEKTYGNELLTNGGLTVVTSLDWKLQSIAERQVRDKVLALGAQHVTDGSLVALDPKTGDDDADRRYADRVHGRLQLVAAEELRRPLSRDASAAAVHGQLAEHPRGQGRAWHRDRPRRRRRPPHGGNHVDPTGRQLPAEPDARRLRGAADRHGHRREHARRAGHLPPSAGHPQDHHPRWRGALQGRPRPGQAGHQSAGQLHHGADALRRQQSGARVRAQQRPRHRRASCRRQDRHDQ
ncbi:MAG: hypothetical protein E6I88_12640 [Chloroflexi bacterium]|nr:MAG: hypothetical protein E6I88_12640 [Chloroflexota bacterium]